MNITTENAPTQGGELQRDVVAATPPEVHTDPTSQLPTAHWTELLFNPYRYALHPEMLSDTGYKQVLSVRLVGMSKFQPPKDAIVIFDRAFVLEKLRRDVVEKLDGITQRQMVGLLQESWRNHEGVKQEMKGGE